VLGCTAARALTSAGRPVACSIGRFKGARWRPRGFIYYQRGCASAENGRADGGRTARQGALDQRVSAAIITASECAALLAALVILLSMIVNVSALLIPAGIALAFAAKDLSHNFVAGAVALAGPEQGRRPGCMRLVLKRSAPCVPLGDDVAAAGSSLKGSLTRVSEGRIRVLRSQAADRPSAGARRLFPVCGAAVQAGRPRGGHVRDAAVVRRRAAVILVRGHMREGGPAARPPPPPKNPRPHPPASYPQRCARSAGGSPARAAARGALCAAGQRAACCRRRPRREGPARDGTGRARRACRFPD